MALINAPPKRWTTADIPSLDGKIALVTGAASGLGFETARGLSRHGARVIIADRNVAGGEAATAKIKAEFRNATVEFKALDLGDLHAIRQFTTELIATHHVLDILVNVAGILPPIKRATTRDGFELKFGINYLGHFALTGLLLEALLRSQEARVVSVSSLVQRRAQIDFNDLQGESNYQPQRAYNQAKLACLMFALELERLARKSGSRLLSIASHPGIARTGFASGRQDTSGQTLQNRLEALALSTVMRFFGQSSENGSWPLLYAASSPQAIGGAFYGPGGLAGFSGHPALIQPSTNAIDEAARRKLWRDSEELTGVRYEL